MLPTICARHSSLRPGGRSPGTARHSLFLNPGGAALQATQVVKLGPADRAAAGDFQRVNQGRIERENPLDANAAAGGPAHGEVGRGAVAVLAANYHSLKGLNTLSLAFSDAEIDPHRVSGAKVRDFGVAFRF